MFSMAWLPEGWTPKLVAVDIDGTLTDANKLLHLGAVEALRALEAAGIPVIICTGNTRPIAYGLWRFIGLSGPLVCENGGVLWYPSGEVVLRADGREAEDACRWVAEQLRTSTRVASRPTDGGNLNGASRPMRTWKPSKACWLSRNGRTSRCFGRDLPFTSWTHACRRGGPLCRARAPRRAPRGCPRGR